jgi:hypothetical protein
MKKDLSKATFIIPLRIESDDRLRNVITSVCYLLSVFDTNIIIHEVDRESVFDRDALPQIREFLNGEFKNINHVFERSDDPSFHRQRVLNDMIMSTNTEVVVNYDCDILLPIESYVESYEAITSGKVDVVYPYGDGNYQYQVFADDELVTNFLTQDFDFTYLERKSKVYDAKYGFCQFFSKKSYVEGGLENENFVAYAPEDVERFYRFKTLGYNILRIPNHVYHLEHSRSPNSWFNNPYMNQNNEEWERVQRMDKDTLKNYIESQDYYRRRIGG